VGNYSGLIFLALPLLLLYMVFSRMRRQQRAMTAVQAAIEPGLRVMTTSGVHASVVSTEDDGIVVLEIAPGVHTRWARAAIAQVFDDDEHRTIEHGDENSIDVRTNDVPTGNDRDRDDRTLT
jgi:preprotein translocase subunit YajC